MFIAFFFIYFMCVTMMVFNVGISLNINLLDLIHANGLETLI